MESLPFCGLIKTALRALDSCGFQAVFELLDIIFGEIGGHV
jgi:hypothetical protein